MGRDLRFSDAQQDVYHVALCRAGFNRWKPGMYEYFRPLGDRPKSSAEYEKRLENVVRNASLLLNKDLLHNFYLEHSDLLPRHITPMKKRDHDLPEHAKQIAMSMDKSYKEALDKWHEEVVAEVKRLCAVAVEKGMCKEEDLPQEVRKVKEKIFVENPPPSTFSEREDDRRAQGGGQEVGG